MDRLSPERALAFLEISVGQTEPQIPPHRQENHFGREPEGSEHRQTWRRSRNVTMMLHFDTLVATMRSVNATVPLEAMPRQVKEPG